MEQSLYLIRHAESALNVTPHLVGGRSNEAHLTDEGVLQATRLGEFLLNERIEPISVYSSPARRTLETAHHTLDAMKLKMTIITDDPLQELDQGEFVGLDRSAVYTSEVLQEIAVKGKDFKAPGGESMNEAGARMKDWADSLPVTNGVIFGFAHGVAIRCFISTLENWTHAQTNESYLANTSITRLDRVNGAWHLTYFGKDPQPKQ